MTIDPNGQTFWYLGQYSKNTGTSNGRWGTYIRALSYPNCDGGGGDNLSVDVSAKAGGTAGGEDTGEHRCARLRVAYYLSLIHI